MVKNNVPEFMLPPLVNEDSIMETLTYDVAVVGAGTSGLSAAVSAAEENVRVVLIEKNRSYVGRGGENTALNSRLHKKAGIQINVDEIVRKLMEFSCYDADERLIRLWASNSGTVMDWVIDICEESGVKTWLVIPGSPPLIIDKWPPTGVAAEWSYTRETHVEYPTVHRFGDTPGLNQSKLLSALERKARKLGVDVRYNTEAIKLERADNDRVTAVIAKKREGNLIRIKVNKGVILATGDYSNNKTLVEYYLPENIAKLAPIAYGMIGTGHLMACWIGAQMEPKPHPAMVHAFHILGLAPFLMVDKFGKRFVNEDLDPVYFANQCLKLGGVWVVFDSDWPKYVNRLGPKLAQIWKVDEKTQLEELIRIHGTELRKSFSSLMVSKLGPDFLVKGSTLNDLAREMKNVTPEIDMETFTATVSRYNELCEKGFDYDFGKRSDRLFPVKTPPFYAQWKPSANMLFLVTLGGLIVNEKLQALDADGKPIPGLYCSGNTIGRRFGLYYPLMLPGLSHGMALTYGYIAGKNVSKDM